MTINEITAAPLGPGLLESAYLQCLCPELQLEDLPFLCEQSLPVVYKVFDWIVGIVWT